MFRLRFFHKDASSKLIEADQYKEYGSFIDGEFNVIRSEKDETSALIELEMIGIVKNPNSNDKYPCKIIKIISIEDSQITLKMKCKFEKILGKEVLLKEILDTLHLGIDLPFFFNGDHNKFHWESNQVYFLDEKLNHLLKPFEFAGQHFKAYDESYDLNIEFSFNDQSKTNTDSIKIYKFPIVAYVFTDEGYKKIYQGINLLTQFKLKKNLEYEIIININ